jgi:hypothetical protein
MITATPVLIAALSWSGMRIVSDIDEKRRLAAAIFTYGCRVPPVEKRPVPTREPWL